MNNNYPSKGINCNAHKVNNNLKILIKKCSRIQSTGMFIKNQSNLSINKSNITNNKNNIILQWIFKMKNMIIHQNTHNGKKKYNITHQIKMYYLFYLNNLLERQKEEQVINIIKQ